MLAYFEGGFRQITNNKRPINEPADLKGIKMRTPNSALRIKMFNQYGANAAALPYPELYSALSVKRSNPRGCSEAVHSRGLY